LPGRKLADTPQGELAKFAPQYRRYREATQSGTSQTGLATTTIRRRPQQDRQAVGPASGVTDRIASGSTGNTTRWMDLAPAVDKVPTDVQPRRIGTPQNRVMPASMRLPSVR
jgi:hypothetical protein